ncbi:MAG: hypothetical protein A3K19_16705 [Lentisphaerae bacterium RIFOXYB12_FULL_65_16]|nr:MAG: hypothetical protein A3K18_26705 [Lentisphaerae bacterium RIFOXYA12_64_32]OGV88961.1 MAG: hypothetical protein A3K19_16705 [Lentisphaerae bacterium RIFOXYB12_FULL_65_16]
MAERKRTGSKRRRRSTVEVHQKSAPPRVHRHTLIEINRAVFTARRKAAHERAFELLREEIPATAKEKERRAAQYQFCLQLFDDAMTATQRSQIEQETPVLQYLRLIRETVSANLALVHHELALIHQAAEFSRLLGDTVLARFQIRSDVVSEGERGVLERVSSLLQFGDPILRKDDEERMATFTPDDHRRYRLALREYRRFYRRPLACKEPVARETPAP